MRIGILLTRSASQHKKQHNTKKEPCSVFAVQEWIKPRRLKYLGLSPLFGTGKYVKGSREYRFLVLRRLGTDLHRLFSASDSRFSDKTAFSIGLRMVSAFFVCLFVVWPAFVS